MSNKYRCKELSVNCDEYVDVCRLRYQNFFNRYLNDKQDLVEIIAGIPSLKPCKYDKHSIIFAVYNHEQECIGSIRLTIRDSKQNNFLEIEETNVNKLKFCMQDDFKIAEVGRLAVDTRYRSQTRVVFMLFNCITQYSLRNKLDYLVCEAPKTISQYYERLGFEVVDENIAWSVNENILLNHLFFDIRRSRTRANFYGYMMRLLVKNPYLFRVFFT